MTEERYRITVRTQDRITLPPELCERWGIKNGSILQLEPISETKGIIEVLVK